VYSLFFRFKSKEQRIKTKEQKLKNKDFWELLPIFFTVAFVVFSFTFALLSD